jgi:serine/threonine protein kinase
MSLCINPDCPKPQNLDSNMFCLACGSELLLDGRYRVVNQLGKGGFGCTYEVRELSKTVINNSGLPKILKLLINNQPKAVELFQREADVLAKLNHPGIPVVDRDGYFTFLPRGATQPLHCLIMEKISGIDLRKYMRRRGNQPISESLAIEWLNQAALILREVHQRQFFHRDIKPSNIMLNQDGQLVLIDFGAVREITETYLAKHSDGDITGIHSPGYTAPEQLNGQAVLQSDFYSLGRTFVYLLTGKKPNDMFDSATGRLNWRSHAPQVSTLFADLLDQMMAFAPNKRPANADEILQRLQEINPTLQPSPPAIAPATDPDPAANLPPTVITPVPTPEPAPIPQGYMPYNPPQPQPEPASAPTSNPPDLLMKRARGKITSAWITGVLFGLLYLLFSFDETGLGVVIAQVLLALLFFGLAFGIYKGNRVCAVAQLLLFALYFVYVIWLAIFMPIASGTTEKAIFILLAGFLCYFAYRGVVGTFAYQKLIKSQRNH